MPESNQPLRKSRHYPVFWEKAVPIFLIVLAIAVLLLLGIIAAVAFGQFGI